MKTGKIFFKILVSGIILFHFMTGKVLSQGTDSRIYKSSSSAEKLYFGINVAPKTAGISHDESSLSALESKKGNSMDYSLEMGIYFTRNFGISLGAGLSSFSSSLTLGTYTVSYETQDDEEEEYEMRISGTGMTEKQKIGLASIPFCLMVRLPAGERIRFNLSGGISVNIPVIKSYEGDGTFSYKGFYPAYPVLLEDLPQHNFQDDYATNVQGALELNPMILAISASGGVSVFISEKMQIGVAANYIRSAGNISGYDNSEFILTSGMDELESMMGSVKAAGLQSIGISIGLKMYLK